MIEPGIVPLTHIAIAPDGNRRWSRKSGLPVWEGHKRSAETFQFILEVCKEQNIPYLTLWGFSTENWKRDSEEVKFLMDLFSELLRKNTKDFVTKEIKFTHIGRKDRFPKELVALLNDIEQKTAHFSKWHLQIALDYGGRDEIVRATNKIIADAKEGKITEINEELYKSYLDTAGIPDPDLIIRTSGEKRLSGLLTFQGVYSELEFSDLYFPELNKEVLTKIIDDYYSRQRRFGGG